MYGVNKEPFFTQLTLGQLQCILKIIISTILFKNAKLSIKKKANQVFQNFGVGRKRANKYLFFFFFF